MGKKDRSGLVLLQGLLDVKTLFLSILLEAIPFVLMGVFFSALLQTFVTPEQVRRWTPKSPLLAIPFAALLGLIFPVCECGIVPVVRKLIQKGMPIPVGIVFLLAGPVVNPIVLASTYVAFPRMPHIAIERTWLAFLVAVITGTIIWLSQRSNPLKHGVERELRHEVAHAEREQGKLSATFGHAVDEFFEMGKYLLFGALISALIQVMVSRETLIDVGNTPVTSHLVMMGMAYIFSLCSEADAFIASSFATTFSSSSLLAFLVFGPMVDVKSTLMMLGLFRFSFVVKLIGIVAALVLILTLWLPV